MPPRCGGEARRSAQTPALISSASRSMSSEASQPRLTDAPSREKRSRALDASPTPLPDLQVGLRGYAPGVTTSTICGIIFPVMRSHEILMLVTRPAWTRTEARRIEDLKETSPSSLMSKEME